MRRTNLTGTSIDIAYSALYLAMGQAYAMFPLVFSTLRACRHTVPSLGLPLVGLIHMLYGPTHRRSFVIVLLHAFSA